MTPPDVARVASGYIVWPEGQPERARFARTWLGMQWLMLGPMGWRASLKGRRMSSAWPFHPSEDHYRIARCIERGPVHRDAVRNHINSEAGR